MKKILVFMMIVSLFLLCACRGNTPANNNESVDGTTDVTDPVATDASGNGEFEPDDSLIDWETPIDIDDSFDQESSEETEPEDASAPSESTEPDQTEDPTESGSSVEEPTEAVIPATGPSSSGGIELPMIPG